MKWERFTQWVLVFVFVVFIAAFCVLFWVLPKAEMSQLERRQLSDAPTLSTQSLFSGAFGKEAETYLSDHFPARSQWVGMYAKIEQWIGRNGQNGIYLGENERLFVAPTAYQPAVIDRNMTAIQEFVTNNALQGYYLIVPSAGSLDGTGLPLNHQPYHDAQIMADITDKLADLTAIIPTLSTEHFYRTDHHWTSLGAYQAYLACAQELGFSPLAQSAFDKETISDFYGTSYAKAGLWQVAGDNMELWHSDTTFRVEIRDAGMAEPVVSNSVFFRDALNTMDKYTVYLDGNHAQVRIINPRQQGKLLVLKDSFAQTLVPFLAEHYGQVDMIDLRHFRQETVSEFVQREGYTQVLFIYGVDTVGASNDLLWLQ